MNSSPKPIPVFSNAFEKSVEIERKYGLNAAVSRILAVRGFDAGDDLLDFLQPKLKNIPLPDTLPDIDRAISRIIKEIEIKKNTIGIFGDYDVDGIGSASMWQKFLNTIKINTFPLISRRGRGYGLTSADIDDYISKDVKLLIAVDVGSTDYEAVRHARENGIDIVIIDHHHITEPWPDAYAIVNPLRHDSLFKYTAMASVGLTFYMIAALRSRLAADGYFPENELPDVKNYLDIVALGTLADVAPLRGINRNLVHYGLNLIRKKVNPSIKALCDVVGIQHLDQINEKSIVFKIVPKLNAPGRMGDARISFELLTSMNYTRAQAISHQLTEINHKRQKIQEKMLQEAMEQAAASLEYRWPIIVSGEDWHPGVVGIVAAKLAEQFKRPAAAVALLDENTGRGSVRSYGGANIYEVLDKLKHLLISFGGHEGAAGIEIERNKIGRFAADMDSILKPLSDVDQLEVSVDIEATFGEITEEFLNQLEMLAPFGNANPEVVVYTKKLEVVSVRYPKAQHLSVLLRDPVTRTVLRAIGFNMASLMTELNQFVNIIYVPEKDQFRGGKVPQLRLLHIWSDN